MFPTIRVLTVVTALVTLGAGGIHAVPQTRATPLALIERAADALGGREAIRGLAAFRIHIHGGSVSPSGVQARSPRATTNLLFQERHYLVDIAGSRGRRESSQVSPGPVRFHTLAVATPEKAQTVDLLKWRSGTDIQNQPAAVGKAALVAWGRLTPHGAVQQALASAATLKDAGTVERDGRTLDAVTYTDSGGTTITLLLEASSGLPFSASPGEGANSAFEYGDYKKNGTLQVPQRFTSRTPGGIDELRIAALDLQPAISAADFELPPGYSDPPPLGAPRAVKVAEGVYRLDGMPQNYHAAFIVDGNDVSVFDAPLSPDWSAVALTLIRETAGETARVVRVLISHHHGDHSGGIAPYVAAGATVVCGAGVDEFLRGRLPEAQRGSARFEVITGSKSVASGTIRIDAHPVPNEHADGNIAYYLPGERILLQGDLFYVPERGPVPPAFSVTSDLARVIDGRRLDVRTIIGVHGRQGTIEELRESLDRRSGLHGQAR